MDTSTFCYYCLHEDAVQGSRCRYCGRPPSFEVPLGLLPHGAILNGRYLVGEYLGIGGYGITYRAYDIPERHPVAIKEYRPRDFCERSENGYSIVVKKPEEFRYGFTHFQAEATILNSLQHIPEVVRYFRYFTENNTAYYSMEYLEGDTLQTYLKKRRDTLSFSDAFRLLVPVMLALDRVHAAGTLHRDISPDNIFICKDKTVRLIDFGASRTKTDTFSNSFAPLEKEGYSPPEQHTIERAGTNQGPWSDVYAMACTFYRCVTGRIPPAAIRRMAGESLSFSGGKLTEAQISVLQRNMSLKIDERASGMLAFTQDLVSALGKRDADWAYEHYPVLKNSPEVEEELWAPPSPLPPPPPPPPPPISLDWSTILRRLAALGIDLFLFQLVPFAAGSLLGHNVLLWLLGGYFLGVFACSYTTAFFLGASPGEFLMGLSVLKENGNRPDGASAVIYTLIRLLWPVMVPGSLLSMLVSGRWIDTMITGYAAVKADNASSKSVVVKYPVLFIQEGIYKGTPLTLEPGKYAFGRLPIDDELYPIKNILYPIDYIYVSRHQFMLEVDQNYQLFIKDTSSYGTWLNNLPLEKNKPTVVSPGSVISFANNQEKILVKNT